jgi:hypothetical protein
MADVYVYRFTGWDGPTQSDIKSRRATLETIKEIGDPIMESQIVVDDAELDSKGFFYGSVANDSDPMQDLTSEIHSLNLRADARDSEALKLDETSGASKYMLQLESRELRKQAHKLHRQQQSELATAEAADHSDMPEFQLGASPTAG